MNTPARVWICSGDTALVRKLHALSDGHAETRVVESLRDLDLLSQGVEGLVLLLDLQTPDYARGLELAVRHSGTGVTIAIAATDSEPARQAFRSGLYAVIAPACGRQEFQALLVRALEHVRLLQECIVLRAGMTAPTMASASPPPPAPSDSRSLRAFSLALRDFDRLDALCRQIVDGVASVTRVSRVGLFYRAHEDEPFTLQAGVRCLERIRNQAYPETHPLALWLQANAHLISRMTLEHIPDPQARHLLRQSMDLLGAEVLIPIHTRQHFAGWLLLGHHVTGRPFSHAELEDLMTVTEHVAVVIENVRLYEEVSLRKSLAETLFDNLPTGIVATTAGGTLLWINRSAADILGIDPARHLGRPVDELGSRLADCIHRTLGGRELRLPELWRLPPLNRTLSVQTRRLQGLHEQAGAVALIQDVTDQRLMLERQEQMARCAFWAELAASMSHEVRNPLVAIKTFAQLLPERHTDAEFRTQFSEVVSQEVDRLDSIVKQMNHFANLPRPQLAPIDIREPLQRGQDAAKLRVPTVNCQIHVSIPPEAPRVLGDSRVLGDCFCHLFANAMEAMSQQSSPRIEVQANLLPAAGDHPLRLQITITDNGGGIEPEMLDKVYSPFYTTKSRAMGLGLAIVQRMLLDHNGHIELSSSTQGTIATLVLPAEPPATEGVA